MKPARSSLELNELILEYSASRILFVDPNATDMPRLVVSLRDVTERASAEERFRATFDQAAVGMAVVATDGRILRANRRLCAITGYTAGELLARTSGDLTHPDDREADVRQKARLLANEIGSYTVEKRYVGKNGTPIWVRLTMSIVRRSDRAADCFIALVEEVTQRRNLETQLIQAQKMDAIGQLAGGVAHDFNNILTVIQGHATLLALNQALTAGARESVEEIAMAARRATSLTRQLLLFSRREVLQPQWLNLNDNVRQLARMLQRLIGENVRMTLQLCVEAIPVYADAGMLDQLLMNLAINARDAMPRGGELVIGTHQEEVDAQTADKNVDAVPGHYACLTVADNGCGIPPDVLPRIFEPFFTTKEFGKGTGLGLATVFGIVKQHRGWIRVQSEIGRGATFRVYLPTGERPTAPAEPLASDRLRSPEVTGERVLFVEDDDAVRLMATAVLQRHGYTVIACASAPEALEHWTRSRDRIDLLVTDLVLPGMMNGQGLADLLRQERPDLKVLLASGYCDEIAGRALELKPGEVFLQKPYQLDRLLAAVDGLLHPNRSGERGRE